MCRTLFGKYNSINKRGYSIYREWAATGYPSRHCGVNRKGGET
jgi:hypothetical protein